MTMPAHQMEPSRGQPQHSERSQALRHYQPSFHKSRVGRGLLRQVRQSKPEGKDQHRRQTDSKLSGLVSNQDAQRDRLDRQFVWSCSVLCKCGSAQVKRCAWPKRLSKSYSYRYVGSLGNPRRRVDFITPPPFPGCTAGTGLVYLLFWPLYQGPSARFICATVPGLASCYFFMVGIGACKDKRLLERSTVRGLTLPWVATAFLGQVT